jgi:hypothetical protein
LKHYHHKESYLIIGLIEFHKDDKGKLCNCDPETNGETDPPQIEDAGSQDGVQNNKGDIQNHSSYIDISRNFSLPNVPLSLSLLPLGKYPHDISCLKSLQKASLSICKSLSFTLTWADAALGSCCYPVVFS